MIDEMGKNTYLLKTFRQIKFFWYIEYGRQEVGGQDEDNRFLAYITKKKFFLMCCSLKGDQILTGVSRKIIS